MAGTKTAHKPMLHGQGLDVRKVRSGEGFMLYFIDAGKNHSKFYEGLMLPNDDGTYRVLLRWGALTDSGFTGRIDGGKFDAKHSNLGEGTAKSILAKKYRAKTGKGYVDAWRHQGPKGQYPVGLTRDVGFGWGVQETAFCIPSLRNIRDHLDAARTLIKQGEYSVANVRQMAAARVAQRDLRSVDSTMSKKIVDNIKHMQGRASNLMDGGYEDAKAAKVWGVALSRLISYLDKQLSVCHSEGKVARQRSFSFVKQARSNDAIDFVIPVFQDFDVLSRRSCIDWLIRGNPVTLFSPQTAAKVYQGWEWLHQNGKAMTADLLKRLVKPQEWSAMLTRSPFGKTARQRSFSFAKTANWDDWAPQVVKDQRDRYRNRYVFKDDPEAEAAEAARGLRYDEALLSWSSQVEVSSKKFKQALKQLCKREGWEVVSLGYTGVTIDIGWTKAQYKATPPAESKAYAAEMMKRGRALVKKAAKASGGLFTVPRTRAYFSQLKLDIPLETNRDRPKYGSSRKGTSRFKQANFNPHSIGEIKRPSGDPDEMRIVEDTDQRWFSEMQKLFPSSGNVWDGNGPAPKGYERAIKLALRSTYRVASRWLAENEE